MVNPRAPVPGVPIDRQPVGVLQYRDLDVLMALYHAWLHGSDHTSGDISVELPEMLSWMGYRRALTKAPYAEIRASLGRLARTQISIYNDSEAEDYANDPDQFETRLLQGMTPVTGERVGEPTMVNATLSPLALDWLRHASQAIDLDVYAHLVRHPATRRIPLARVIWTTMARHRNLNGQTMCRPGWLADRYGDRRDISTESSGRFVYRDSYNPKSKLRRAIEALAQTGALQLDATEDGWITGHYRVPENMDRIQYQPIQRKIWPEFTTSTTDPTGLPAPHSSQDISEQQTEDKWIQRHLSRIRKLIPDLGRSAIDAARAAKWPNSSIGWLTVWVAWSQEYGFDGGLDATAGARWMTRLRGTSPDIWSCESVVKQIRATGHYNPDKPTLASLDSWMAKHGLSRPDNAVKEEQ